MKKAKQFEISQTIVEEAFKRVKANKGAAGSDNQSIEDFERDLERNLYKVWNRMSSGTYFPPAVKCVEIPKGKKGEVRTLGVPTVADRVAQMVAKMYLEPEVEPKFDKDSYGYRPFKSPLGAIGKARERCHRMRWVVDLDIQAFFDSLDHELVIEQVKQYTDQKWILLYVERWLKAPLQKEDGTVEPREIGSPQGSVISPLLANIVLHHVFDSWMRKCFPNIQYERYADDIVLHCHSKKQAEYVKDMISKRLSRYKPNLHPKKTKIVHCARGAEQSEEPFQEFDFLGYTFKARPSRKSDGTIFRGFGPAISKAAAKEIRETIKSWKLQMLSGATLEDLAKIVNPKVRGWINYYGQYRKSDLYPVLARVNTSLWRWTMRKYKRYHRKPKQARGWLIQESERRPELFAHWQFGVKPWLL